MISNFLRIFEPNPSERFSNTSYKLSLLSNFGNKSSFSCNVGLNPYRLYPFFLKIEKNVFTLFFNLFILGDLIPVTFYLIFLVVLRLTFFHLHHTKNLLISPHI